MHRITAFVAALALALATVVAPAMSRPAAALDYWCWDDPLLEIAGQRVSINIGVRERDLNRVIGSVVLVIVPENVPVRLIKVDDTFPVWVRIEQRGRATNGNIPVTVHNTLFARGSFDYQMNVTKDDGMTVIARANGLLTNRLATLAFNLRTR